ncbi:hypothetical protein VTL71DRAFT_13241 [Oculimacula yallundae]|uniref:Uncharacterized protein n=1 Tax=Oculimacula yallundae TaxID=86028 RepID=A0ABR4CJW5_9HELO
MPAIPPVSSSSREAYVHTAEHLEKYEMTVIRSPHWMNIQMLAALFETQQYSACDRAIRAIMLDRTKVGKHIDEFESHYISEYYNGQYLLLLSACCDDEDKQGRMLAFQALNVLRHAVQKESKSPRSQELLETLVFIAVVLILYFGGVEKQVEEPTDFLKVETKKLLRSKSAKELGLEALMIHYALIVELRRVAIEAGKDVMSCMRPSHTLETAAKVPKIVLQRPSEDITPGIYDVQRQTDKKRPSPSAGQPGSDSPPKRHQPSPLDKLLVENQASGVYRPQTLNKDSGFVIGIEEIDLGATEEHVLSLDMEGRLDIIMQD